MEDVILGDLSAITLIQKGTQTSACRSWNDIALNWKRWKCCYSRGVWRANALAAEALRFADPLTCADCYRLVSGTLIGVKFRASVLCAAAIGLRPAMVPAHFLRLCFWSIVRCHQTLLSLKSEVHQAKRALFSTR
jgi:hypothetical protein